MTQVALTPTATADLRRLDPAVARRVVTKLHRLAENIETVRLETLAGPWQGVFKLRVGDYRVLYSREDEATGRRSLHQASSRGVQDETRPSTLMLAWQGPSRSPRSPSRP